MKRILLLLSCLLTSLLSTAQTPTWNQDIAPFFALHCNTCHNGKITFPLTTLEAVRKNAEHSVEEMEHKQMPIWPADPAVSHFANENVPGEEKIKMLKEWIKAGMPAGEGPEASAEPAPNPRDAETPALTLTNHPYTLAPAKGNRYVTFTGAEIQRDLQVSAIRFRPGMVFNIVRMDLYALESAGMLPLTATREDTVFTVPSAGGFPPVPGRFLAAWKPGTNDLVIPGMFALKLNRGSRLALVIQYQGINAQISDTSTVELFEQGGNPMGEVLVQQMKMTPPAGIFLPAGEVVTHTLGWKVQEDIGIFSLYPSFNFFGKNLRVVAHLPGGDSLNLLSIPRYKAWWQFNYLLQSFARIPAGSTITCTAVFNNTEKNRSNPVKPLQPVMYSRHFNQETFEFNVYYVKWIPGIDKIGW